MASVSVGQKPPSPGAERGPPHMSSYFLPSYRHRWRTYRNEDVLVVNQPEEVLALMQMKIRRGERVTRSVSVASAKESGDALVRIVNGHLSYGLILCRYDPAFVAWARQNGYQGVIIAMDPRLPGERLFRDGFDGGVRVLDDVAMRGLVRVLKDVIREETGSESETFVQGESRLIS